MQEKKNKQLIALFVVLIAATVSVYWLGRDQDNFAVDKELFRSYDLKSVSEVVLESPGEKLSLKFNGTRWMVNGRFDADANLVEVLFATLKQAEPKRPLAGTQQDSIADVLRKTGVKVSLFSGADLVKTFYAGGNSEKTQAYFLDDIKPVPYLMAIPGYRVYVSGIFELPEQGWRDKLVFGFNWRNFQSLEVHFPKKPTEDFRVAMDNNFFGIQGMEMADTTKLNDFLDNVSLLTVDEFAESTPALDSLSKTPAFISFLIKDISQKDYTLQLFLPPKKGQPIPGLINGSQWALFQQKQINGIVQPRRFFGK